MTDTRMAVETVNFSDEGNDGFIIDWATEVALGGPDTAPDGEDASCSNNLHHSGCEILLDGGPLHPSTELRPTESLTPDYWTTDASLGDGSVRILSDSISSTDWIM
jgi:hypothetical protein